MHATRGGTLAATLLLNVAAPVLLHGWLLRAAATTARVRIIDVSSGATTKPYPGWASYCASKAALDMAGQVLAAEIDEVPAHAGRDVAVVSFAPGVVATEMQVRLRQADPADFPRRDRFVALQEDGALLEPEAPATEIAALLD